MAVDDAVKLGLRNCGFNGVFKCNLANLFEIGGFGIVRIIAVKTEKCGNHKKNAEDS